MSLKLWVQHTYNLKIINHYILTELTSLKKQLTNINIIYTLKISIYKFGEKYTLNISKKLLSFQQFRRNTSY